jgi:CheY-like chemotaxis protein
MHLKRVMSLSPSLASATEPRRATSTPPSASRVRVLVVDDEPLIGLVIRRTLRDCDVVAVDAIARAIDLVEGGAAFDLVLCDLMMPAGTGMDLHARWSKERPALAERMVFMTGGAFTDAARFFVESMDAARVISKPFTPTDLRRRAREAAALGPLAAT